MIWNATQPAVYLVEFEGLHRRKAALVVNGEQLQVQRIDLIDRRRRLRPALGLGQLGNLCERGREGRRKAPICRSRGGQENTEKMRRNAMQINAIVLGQT